MNKSDKNTPLNSKYKALHVRGMSIHDIAATLLELYDVGVPPALIFRVTEQAPEQVQQWQSRPLDEPYPIVYLDCVMVNIRQEKRVIDKAITWHWAPKRELKAFAQRWMKSFLQSVNPGANIGSISQCH